MTPTSIRVVREFSNDLVSEEDLTAILDAGRHAGSSKNQQRWAFVIVRDAERLKQLAGSGPFAAHVGRASVAVALITPDPLAPDAPLSIMFDLGRVAQNMVIAAWERQIGSCPATVYDQAVVRETLELPPSKHCEYILSFGHPADDAVFTQSDKAGGRTPLADLLHNERW